MVLAALQSRGESQDLSAMVKLRQTVKPHQDEAREQYRQYQTAHEHQSLTNVVRNEDQINLHSSHLPRE